MKKRIKKMMGFILSVSLMLGMCISTYASENPPNLGEVVDGSLLTNENESEISLYNRARGNILDTGAARISEIGSGQINAYGAVMAAVKCDTLRLEINIQQLRNGNWVNIKNYSSTASNASLLTKSYNYTVSKGYYYRVMAGCIATKGGTTETKIPITNGIWID